MAYKNLDPFDVKSDKLVFVPFPADQYIPQTTDKKQIVLHHTVSDPSNSQGDLSYWLSTTIRVATAVVIQNDGKAFQCFSSRLWGYHLGAGNWKLDAHSIGIEIDNWGGLILGNGENCDFGDFGVKKTQKDEFYNAYGNIVKIPENTLIEFPQGFRGYKYFQKYTESQLDTVGELLLLWNKTYGIPLDYNEEMFDISQRALSGESGIWSHTSYIKEKSDVFPQPDLIEMLKSLKK